MFHLSGAFRTPPNGFGILGLIDVLMLPECYSASSIKDFLDSRDSISVPPYKLCRWASIDFTNVTLEKRETAYRLRDLTGEMIIRPANFWSHPSAEGKRAVDGRYFNATVCYSRSGSDERVWLQSLQRFGPPEPEPEHDLVAGPLHSHT